MPEKNKLSLSLIILFLATLAIFKPQLGLSLAFGISFLITIYRWPQLGILAVFLATLPGEFVRLNIFGIHFQII